MGERAGTAQVATGVTEHGGTDDAGTSRAARLRGVDVRSDTQVNPGYTQGPIAARVRAALHQG